ncbi:MAG: hypothetical protein LUE29_05885 [Lachnospiraceae bacterium]|nr:hypothetical protein [Lachnospiraceae bacterium]
MDICLEQMGNRATFKKEELFDVIESLGRVFSERYLEKYLSSLQKKGEIARVGRNTYCIMGELQDYYYSYADTSEYIANILTSDFYDLDFRIMEMYQLNRFINHQIAHNVIFVYVEKELCHSAFERLKKEFAGKILINPREEDFYNYRTDDLIIVRNLMTESPKGRDARWHTELEKLLVDVFSENLVKSMLGESEYPQIFETAFQNYVIDESRMFRYAGRRKTADKIKNFLEKETDVKLRTR